jgi:hypothetical protein
MKIRRFLLTLHDIAYTIGFHDIARKLQQTKAEQQYMALLFLKSSLYSRPMKK